MQAFKRHLISNGCFIIAWDSDHGSGWHVMPAYIPFKGNSITGKYLETRHTTHARMHYFGLLEAAALLRYTRQQGGSFACVIGAHECLDAAKQSRKRTEYASVKGFMS